MEKIITEVHDLLKEAKKFKKIDEEEKDEDEKFYFGHQWKQNQKRPVKNWCFSTIESEVPVITDSRPGVSVISNDENRMEDAKILDSAIQYVMDQQQMSIKIPAAVKNALITGDAWQYIGYDADGENGEGSIFIKQMNRKFVFIDPLADEIGEARYVILEYPIDLSEIKRKFPGVADKLAPTGFSFEDSGIIPGIIYDPARWHPGNSMEKNSSERYNLKNICTFTEAYLKDYTSIPIDPELTTVQIGEEAVQLLSGVNPDISKYEDHKGHIGAHKMLIAQAVSQRTNLPPESIDESVIEQAKNDPELSILMEMINDHIAIHEMYLEVNPQGLQPKYKNNMRLVCYVGSTLLHDGEPDVNDGLFPLVPYYCYKNDSCYGMGEIRQIKPVQKTYNDMDYSEYKSLRLNANSGWIKDDNSNVSDSDLTNEEGIVVTKTQGTEVRRLEPGQVSPQLMQRKNADQNEIGIISGINEQTQGRQPTSEMSGKSIRLMQQQSIGRIRLKSRMVEEYTMPLLGKLLASRIVKYWSEERMLKLYDSNGRIKFVTFSPDKVRDLQYEIKSVPGSTGSIDKEGINATYMQLLQLGAITLKQFLDVSDLPYKNKIIDALEQQEQQQLAAQGAAMQAQPQQGQIIPGAQ